MRRILTIGSYMILGVLVAECVKTYLKNKNNPQEKIKEQVNELLNN